MIPLLYDAELSPAGKRVRMALWLGDVRYQRVRIDLGLLDQKSEAYLALNPTGVVPTYRDGAATVYDSHLILEYLAEQGLLVLPDVSSGRVAIAARKWMVVERELARLMRPAVYETVGRKRLRQRFSSWDEALAALSRRTANRGYLNSLQAVFEQPENTALIETTRLQLEPLFAAAERILDGQPWLAGSVMGMADLAMGSRLAVCSRLELLDQERYPGLAAYLGRLQDEPCWSGADDQPWHEDFLN